MSTGRAHVHALASLSIVCVLTTLSTAGTLTISNRNGSNYSSFPGSIILEPYAEVEQSKYQNGTQNNSSEYNNMKQNISMNAKQEKIQPVEFNKTEIPTLDKLKSSNEILTSKLSQNESHLYEESPYVTNEKQNSETGSEDTLDFKQYNFTGNTVAESVTTNSFKNAQTLVENKILSTHDDSSSISQKNSKHLSTDVFKHRESRQLSPGQYASYFIGPKLWYVPLFFSIYFLCYVTALIIKAISRHKILFPSKSKKVARLFEYPGKSLVKSIVTNMVLTAIETAAKKYL